MPKRYCKNVNILDPLLVKTAVLDCLHKGKKRRRRDTVAYFGRMAGVSVQAAEKMLLQRTPDFFATVDKIVASLIVEMESRKIKLPNIYHHQRQDKSSGKVRKISILHIKNLILDHVAVTALEPVLCRLGAYQVSGLPDRGAQYGARALRRWLKNKRMKYAVKLDIKDCYGSTDRAKLLAWLRLHVKNEPLLWLVSTLVHHCDRGLSIGSYLSQTLAQLYLSELYHLACKNGKKVLFYMDDMVLLSTNRRHLRRDVRELVAKAASMGYLIKPNWCIFRVSETRPLDVMGFRFSRGRVTVRKRIFRRARRALMRIGARIKSRRRVPVALAMRLLSYKGWLLFANCSRFLRRHNADFVFAVAAKRVSLFSNLTSTNQSNHDRQKPIFRKARRSPLLSQW